MLNRIFELHWSGSIKLELLPQDVKGSALENRLQALSFLNYAFALFYRLRQGIASCNNAKMRERMAQTL